MRAGSCSTMAMPNSLPALPSMPQAVVEKLADALSKGLDDEAVQKRLADLGADRVEQSRRGPQALANLVKSEAARLMPILKAAAEK